MTSYRKSMMESLAEVRGLQEDNMDLMRKAAGKGGMQTLKMKDGKLKMDKVTASAMMQIFDKVSPDNQKKMEKMINDGKKSGIIKLSDFAMSKVTGFKSEETELDEGREKSARQLVNPNKEVMVVKKNSVIVIDKKDQDKYLKQGWSLAEEVEELDEDAQDYEVAGIGQFSKKDAKKKYGTDVKYDGKKSGRVTKVGRLEFGPMKGKQGYEIEDGKTGKIMQFTFKEEVELDEAPKYELYHKDFSTAMQHAYKMAKKLHGITVKPSEIDDKVASGPRKPSEGKTNSYRLEGDKGAIQVQVYNKGGSKPYELNFYKEEVELDEWTVEDKLPDMRDALMQVRTEKPIQLDEAASSQVLAHGGKGQYKVVSGPAKDGSRETVVKFKGKVVSTGDYDSGADGWFMNIKGKKGQEFFDDAQKMADYFAKNKITEEVELDEGKMKELHGYIEDGKSAEWIAKKMGVDVKTIKALMSGYKEAWELGTNEYREYLEKLTPGEVDEASARADAKRAMKQDPSMKQDPFSKDDDASDEDIKGASKNLIMQLRKVVSMRGNFDVEFLDKKKKKVPVKIAQAVQDKYNSFKKPADKEKFQAQAAKSYNDMLKVLKAGYMMKAAYEEFELTEAVSAKDFDSIKKGDTVTIDYQSTMSSGKAKFTVSAKNMVGKGKKVEKVTLRNVKNPKGVKHFLYKRDDKVGFAIGDMGASVVSFKKEETILGRIDRKLKEKKNG